MQFGVTRQIRRNACSPCAARHARLPSDPVVYSGTCAQPRLCTVRRAGSVLACRLSVPPDPNRSLWRCQQHFYEYELQRFATSDNVVQSDPTIMLRVIHLRTPRSFCSSELASTPSDRSKLVVTDCLDRQQSARGRCHRAGRTSQSARVPALRDYGARNNFALLAQSASLTVSHSAVQQPASIKAANVCIARADVALHAQACRERSASGLLTLGPPLRLSDRSAGCATPLTFQISAIECIRCAWSCACTCGMPGSAAAPPCPVSPLMLQTLATHACRQLKLSTVSAHAQPAAWGRLLARPTVVHSDPSQLRALVNASLRTTSSREDRRRWC